MNTHRIRYQTVAAFCAVSYLLGSTPVGHAAEDATKPRAPSNVSISITSSKGATATAQLAGEAAIASAARQGLLRPVDGPVTNVDDFRGREIIGADQKRLGQLEDFIVDTATGNLVYAVVAPAGEGSLRLVQKSSLKFSREGFVTDLDQAGFAATESVTREQLDADQFTRIPDESRAVSESVAPQSTRSSPVTTPAIGLLPPAADSTSAATTAAAAHPDSVTPATTEPVEVTAAPSSGGGTGSSQVATHLVRVSTLRGTDIRAGDERLGSIEAIALDMEQGTATAVVAMKDSAVNTTLFNVPLSALQFGAVSDAGIATTLSRSDFARALSLSQIATSSEQSRPSDEERLSPTGRTGAVVNAPAGDRNSPLDTQTSAQAERRKVSNDALADPAGAARLVSNVRLALDRVEGTAAKGIEVNATGKSIQLRGTVRTEEQKARIEAAARKAAGSMLIENDLRIQQP